MRSGHVAVAKDRAVELRWASETAVEPVMVIEARLGGGRTERRQHKVTPRGQLKSSSRRKPIARVEGR